MSIKRSTGYYTGYGGVFAGAGYKGLTEELDAIVVEAAEALAAQYGTDIEIRYNTDRRSGGAWLVDPSTRNTTLAINAGLSKIIPEGKDIEWLIDLDRHDHNAYRALPDKLTINTYVIDRALRDPSMADPTNLNDTPYAYVEQPSLEAAMAWLRKNAIERPVA